MSTSKTILCAGFALAVAAGIGLSRRAMSAEGDVDGIKAQCKAYVAAWNRHDPKAMVALWAEDGDYIDPNGKLTSGQADLQKLFTEQHTGQGAFRESTLTDNVETVRFPTADTAISDAEVTVTGAYGPDGIKVPSMELHVTDVWKKVGNEWRIFACRPAMKPSSQPTRSAAR